MPIVFFGKVDRRLTTLVHLSFLFVLSCHFTFHSESHSFSHNDHHDHQHEQHTHRTPPNSPAVMRPSWQQPQPQPHDHEDHPAISTNRSNEGQTAPTSPTHSFEENFLNSHSSNHYSTNNDKNQFMSLSFAGHFDTYHLVRR